MERDDELEQLRQQLEERTREVSMLRAAIRACPAGIVIASAPNGVAVEWNAAALGMRGGDVAKLTQIEVADYSSRWQTFHEDGRPYASADLPISRALLKGEVVEGAVVVIRDEEGHDRWTSAHAAPVFDEAGAIVAGVVVFPEITQRHEAELAAERFRHMAELSPDFVGVFLGDGSVEYINPAGLTMCGLDESAALMRIEDFYTEESMEMLRSVGIPTAETKGHWRADVDIRHADGTVIPCSQALMLHPEHVTGSVLSVVIRDLRPLRKLESQLRQSQRLETTGRLAGGIAHDFNNLLTIIINYAFIIGASMDESDPRRGDLEQINLASTRAADLCGQLLSFARQQIIKPSVLDVGEVVEELMKLFERTLGEDVLIQQEFAALWPIKVDRSQLDQVLLNLVVNARQAMPDGGTLTIEAENVVVDEHYASTRADVEPGDYVMLAVSDTGVGMSKEVADRVFEPFFTTREHDGTGLGLATVFGAVRQNGGHIWLYSEEGTGTTFKIYWPRFHGAAQIESTPPRRLKPDSAQRTVLVVEDEPLLLRVTTRLLESAGFAVIQAKDGPEALELATDYEGTIDLLLTDIVMPHMNGKELATRLTEARPGIHILYVSGYTQNTIVHGGVLDSGVAFLPKPFSMGSLLDAIAAMYGEDGEDGEDGEE